ncbi:alpha/beta hydrolase [Nocardioides sp. CFH 31398]|uniref:alpha/beta hydrolase n=1 Tax=Nocardioides sp. CFH 31398 TaxID=2919579 RepID=UPI001F05A193|nr:alpha/beta hydrolase [Nocardioides sp. CFH 31398]MCH1867217.1 alpha/beta hydrolase [Nocardioides sp. CFH 31398]
MLHPQARAALERTAAETPVHHPDFDVAAERAAAREAALAEPREDVASATDEVVGGVPCRRYVPLGDPSVLPGVVVHLHGGGFVMNDVEVHDAVSRMLANRSGLEVLSVDYRRPPEDRFPAAVEDVLAVVAALPPEVPLFLHGDSAGANLALVAALRNPGRATALGLVYPFLDPRGDRPSYDEPEVAGSRAVMEWYWQQYAATDADREHPDMAPLLSDALGTLPPTLVVTAEHDPLRDEGEELVVRLADAGVSVVGTRYQGQVHGFWRHPSVFDAAEPLTGQMGAFLRQHAR